MSKKKINKKVKKKSSSNKSFDVLQYLNTFWENRSPGIKFLSIFLSSMILFYIFYFSAFYVKNINPLVVNTQAKIGSFLISLLGESPQTNASIINGKGFAIDISGGCDGVEVTAILIAGILAFPSLWKSKFKGIIVGVAIIATLNLLRIPGLFFAGLNGSMELFDFLHLQGGFIIFVTITVIIWCLWINWTIRTERALLNT